MACTTHGVRTTTRLVTKRSALLAVFCGLAACALFGWQQNQAARGAAPALDADAVKVMVQDEVGRQLSAQLPKLVQAEVQRQLSDLSARTREAARVPSAMSSLHVLRSQIELYGLQHDDHYPSLADLQDHWTVLMQTTDRTGKVVANDAAAFGPYLNSTPKNPFNNSEKVVKATEPTPDAGWTYDEKSHQLKVVVPANLKDQFHDGDYELMPVIDAAKP